MIKKIKKSFAELFLLLDKKLRYLFFFNFIFLLLVSAFEIIGIGSIFVFIGTILDPSKFLAEYENIFFVSYIINLDDQSRLILLSIFLIVFFTLKGIIIFLSQYLFSKFIFDTRFSLSSKLFKGYLFKDYSFHLNHNPSTLNQRILNETNNAVQYFEYYLRLINSIILTIAILIILLYSSSQIGILNILLLIIILFISRLILKNTIKRRSEIRNANDVELFKTIQHAFGSLIETVLFKKELFFINYFNKYLKVREFQSFFLTMVNALPKILLEVLFVFILGLFFIFFVKTSENLIAVLPLLTLIVVSLIRLMPAIQQILMSINVLKFSSVGKDIVLNDIKNFNQEIPNFVQKSSYEKINIKNNIKIQNISFKYDDGQKLVLRDINFEVNLGEKVAITGASGSGKSTLINILTGLLSPSGGNIYIDNKSIFENLKNWQSLISYIPQNIYLIDDTIENNITFSTDENVIDQNWLDEVLKLSNIYNDVYNFKDKTKTLVGNRGIRFSGGQKQRIAIARALFKKPQILIMDEPTSGLDKENEEILLNNILSISKSMTLIMISHNLDRHKEKFTFYKLNNGFLIKE